LCQLVETLFRIDGETFLYSFYIVPNLTNDLVLGINWLADQMAFVYVMTKTVLLRPELKTKVPKLPLQEETDSTLSYRAMEVECGCEVCLL